LNPNRLVQSQLSCQLDDAPMTKRQRIEWGAAKSRQAGAPSPDIGV
jgi:hypothetical protein